MKEEKDTGSKVKKMNIGRVKESDHDEETRRRDQREYRLFLF